PAPSAPDPARRGRDHHPLDRGGRAEARRGGFRPRVRGPAAEAGHPAAAGQPPRLRTSRRTDRHERDGRDRLGRARLHLHAGRVGAACERVTPRSARNTTTPSARTNGELRGCLIRSGWSVQGLVVAFGAVVVARVLGTPGFPPTTLGVVLTLSASA